MLLSHYLPKLITALFGGLFISLGIYTFGNALIFDRIFIGVLVFTAVICRHNIDVLGVVIILVAFTLMDEAGWYLLINGNDLVIRIGFYSIAGLALLKLKHDPLSRLLFFSLLISVCAEAFWFITEKKASSIHWYIYTLFLALLTRYLIFVRVSYTEEWFPGKGESINLDWHIYKLNAVMAAVQTASILEFIVRNVFGYKSVLIVYTIYPYLMQAIATYTIWIIFNESYKLLLPKVIRV